MPKAEITYEQHEHTTTYMVWCGCGYVDYVLSYEPWYTCAECGKYNDMRPLIEAWIERPGRLRRLKDHRDELIANLQDIEGQIAKMQEADNERA